MNILKFLLSSFLWAMGGVFVLAIYAYSELVYLIFICIAIVAVSYTHLMQNEINELRKNGKLTPEDTVRIKDLYNRCV